MNLFYKKNIAFLLCISLGEVVQAETYQCVDATGKLSFQDHACTTHEKQKILDIKKNNWVARINNAKPEGVVIVEKTEDHSSSNGDVTIVYTFVTASDSNEFIKTLANLSAKKVNLLSIKLPQNNSLGVGKVAVTSKNDNLFDKH